VAKALSRKQVWTARGIAFAADAVQLALMPLFAGGAPEGADAVFDVGVGAVLCWLCGFHVAFMPTFVAEALPGAALFPTWTLAVLFVTRNRAEPAPAREAAPPDAPTDHKR
jgi:hypothetical protein